MGLLYKDHKIFRLGDIVNSKQVQLFEYLESYGIRVGCISPINAANRLKNPAYFIPDPWTKTNPDNSSWSRIISKALSQSVNDNAKGLISPSSLVALTCAFVRFVRIRKYLAFLQLVIGSFKAPWKRALFLDLFINELHLALLKSRNADFSSVFFNAGAHIQHHYFLSSEMLRDGFVGDDPNNSITNGADPFFDLLIIYDQILSDYVINTDYNFCLLTGLTQKPFNQIQYYYRLSNHDDFLKKIGILCINVIPRMSRDFLINFDSPGDAKNAQEILSSGISCQDGGKLFGLIDNRGESLFVTLTYSKKINIHSEFSFGNRVINVFKDLVFVATKNGHHHETGYAFFSSGLKDLALENKSCITNFFAMVTSYFAIPKS